MWFSLLYYMTRFWNEFLTGKHFCSFLFRLNISFVVFSKFNFSVMYIIILWYQSCKWYHLIDRFLARMSLIHDCRCWSALLSLSVYFLCVVVSAKKGNIYVFKFQTCSKYVRLIVPNEIMKLNRKNWCEILFSRTPHFGQIRFETVAFARWNFLLLIQLKDNKKFQRGFKMHCNFHDAINAIVFP